MMTMIELDSFTRSYIQAALWVSNDESTPQGGEPMDKNYDVDDIDIETLEHMAADCAAFQRQYGELIDEHGDRDDAGHDFWLTRNGHGSGFWDGDWPEIGDKLTTACEHYGNYSLYIGDDGKIHGMVG